ncbi:DnaT-like ssDNA-binding protein [Duganella callida]|uniref:Putative DnaT-like domain-containing protein n=1 Tax=Duganella callida TaxID=2561932 RepID=A0A4Y9S7A9_9BURK|nr:DnaT-like ssDNA-binding protein [Duganella callida]TFW15964.1 hypothetical protein E4L98_25050 [Duganella callida]
MLTETGTGLPNAESYISVADATAHHAAMGNAAWAALASDDLREQALRRATAYMQQTYRARWKGMRTTSSQALDWPRYDVELDDVGYGRYASILPSNVVPAEVRTACADLALRAATGVELSPDLDRTITRETVGPITTEYENGAPEAPRFRSVDRMLAPYLCGSSLSGRMVRG